MPPFQYQTPQNPYVGDMGQMIARRGDIAANAALRAASINAGATVASADAWAGAARDITANVGGQLMKAGQQMVDPARQVQEEQLKAVRRENTSRNILENELRNPANLKDDGTLDDTKMTARLKAQDFGAWQTWGTISTANAKNALDLKEKLAQINLTQADTATKQAALRSAQVNYLGGLAFHTESAMKANDLDPTHARDTFMAGVARAVADGGMTGDQGRDILARTAGAAPDQLQQVLASLVPPDLRGKLEKEQAETAQATAAASKSTAEAAAIRANGLGTPPAAQAKSYRVKMPDGSTKDVPLEYLPGRTATQPGSYFLNLPNGQRQQMFPGKDFTDVPPASIQAQGAASAALARLPGWALDASRPVGAEGNVLDPTLRMTPNGLYQDAQNFIASGQYPPTGRGNDEAAQVKRAAIDSKVGAIAADAGMDVPTLRAFYRSNAASIKQQQSAYDSASVAIAKADRDVDLLQKVMTKVPDVGSPIFNQPLRAFEKNVAGNEDLAEMATRIRSVQNEYTRILNSSVTGGGGGVMSDSARHEVAELLAPDATVGQQLRSIAALKSEGANRLLSQGEQIQRIAARMQTPGGGGGRGAGPAGSGPKQGDVQPIPGHPGAEQTFNGTTWVRSK